MKTLHIILTVLSFTVLCGLSTCATSGSILFRVLTMLWVSASSYGLYCFWREITKNLKEE